MGTTLTLASLDMAGIRLRVDGDTLIAGPRSAITPAIADMLHRDKWQIIAALRGKELAEKQRELTGLAKDFTNLSERFVSRSCLHEAEKSVLQCEIIYLRERLKSQASPPPAIPADMLQGMIGLCHPDRHSNSAAANRVTDWLLKQRRGN